MFIMHQQIFFSSVLTTQEDFFIGRQLERDKWAYPLSRINFYFQLLIFMAEFWSL